MKAALLSLCILLIACTACASDLDVEFTFTGEATSFKLLKDGVDYCSVPVANVITVAENTFQFTCSGGYVPPGDYSFSMYALYNDKSSPASPVYLFDIPVNVAHLKVITRSKK